MKYNLTFWQKMGLPFLWVYWKLSVIEGKKSWHEVKKGIEKHRHSFTIPEHFGKVKMYKCEHEGCYLYDDEQSK